MFRAFVPFAIFPLLVACADVKDPEETNAEEVITTIVLDFTPATGGGPLSFAWADPENDGSPVIDGVTLSDADDYTLSVSFLNELEDPAEDITEEVNAESDQHQVFFTGSAVEGPATGADAAAPLVHAYDDTDANGLPVGLSNTISTRSVGAGTLTVTLRHLPPQNDTAVKVGDLAADVATGGIEALPGETDVTVDFDVTVE